MNPEIEQQPAAVNAKKLAFIGGLIWTGINMFILLVTYYGMPQLLGSPAYGIVSMVISLGLAIYFTLDLRKKVGGYWTFKEALSNIFILFFVQQLLYTALVLGFGKYVEPAYNDYMREVTLNATVEMAEAFGGGDADMVDNMIAEAEASVEKSLNPTLMDFVQAQAIAVIVCFILALIFAAIFKRERPVFAPAVDDEN